MSKTLNGFEFSLNDYCGCCAEFEPVVAKDFDENTLGTKALNKVYCKNWAKCINIAKNLKGEINESEEKSSNKALIHFFEMEAKGSTGCAEAARKHEVDCFNGVCLGMDFELTAKLWEEHKQYCEFLVEKIKNGDFK